MKNTKKASGPKLQNKAVIRKVAKDYVLKNRMKSMVIVIAIALCTFLFTTLFTIGGSILSKLQESTQRQVGTTAAAGFKYLNEEEYEKIAADSNLKEVSRYIPVGEVTGTEFLKLRTEVHWSDEVSAKKGFSYPEAGKLPEKEDEIVVSSLVLQALGMQTKPEDYGKLLGSSLHLSMELKDQETLDRDFTITGIYTGDRVSSSQIVLVSKAFQEKYAPTPLTSYYDRGTDLDEIYGRISVDVDFYLPFNTAGQVASLIERDGLNPETEVGMNWASLTGSMDLATLGIVIVMLITIFTSGYLIINNVYRINVYSDIRSYGLLKTIGMSKKQLEKLVRMQAGYLLIPGLVLGILPGILGGSLLLPVVMNNLSISDTAGTNVQINVWVLLFSAAFSYMTVMVSCKKPARLAASVSPIEAAKYTEGVMHRKGKKAKKQKEQKNNAQNKRYSTFSFAVKNMKRDRKKAALVVLSLTLSLVILNSVYSMIRSFDEDKYVERFVATDFAAADATLDNPAVRERNYEGVSISFLDELAGKPGIEDLGNLYMEETFQEFTDEDFALFNERLLKNPDFTDVYSWDGEFLLSKVYRESKASPVDVYGVDRFMLENLKVQKGELDMEKFLSGGYILVNQYHMELESDKDMIPYFLPGDKISVTSNEGKTKTYEVMALVDIPYAFRVQRYTELDMQYFLPENEYFDLCGQHTPMRTIFNVADEHEAEMEKWMKEYTTKVEPTMDYTSREVYKNDFKDFTQMILIVGGLLTGILALIGLLNLANTLITSIMTRRLELAMLEAVGMTKKMQIRAICAEGLLYALLTGIIGSILCALFSVVLVRNLGVGMWYFAWKFTLMPVAVVFPVMILITLFLPYVIYKKTMKESVVARLRLADN
ncbi:MAG: ABC transporter permease [Lachnospiraceae bacterium]|nr:ABC transporter permease [Lachnospiraceae bacterium]